MLMKWEELPFRERAEYIRTGVKNGLRSIEEVKNAYHKFDEGGPISNEEYYKRAELDAIKNYKKWGVSEDEALTMILNDNTYDYRGWYNDPRYNTMNANADSHWPDTYKTVYHPTFSDESKYSGKISKFNPMGLTGGHWEGDLYQPAPWMDLSVKRFDKGGNLYAEGGPLDGEELEVEGNKFEDEGPKSITDKVKLGLAELDESVFGTLLEKVRDIRNGRFLSNLGESSKNKVFGKRGDNGGTAQRTYLLPRWEQELIFQRDGYIKGKDRDYGLANKAVGDRNLPVYQTAPDAISRENLVPIGNDSFNSDNFGNSYGLNRNTQLYHAGNYPISVYTDTNLDKVYYKGWDLNDYGGTTGPLDYALDAVGSPVVVTTGYQPLQWLNPKKTNKGTYTDGFGNTYPLIEYSDKEGTYNDISIQDLLNPKPNQSNYYYSRIEDVREHVLPMLDAAMKKRGLVRTNIGNAENPEEQYTLPELTVTAKRKKK